jgi:hypothetical protein
MDLAKIKELKLMLDARVLNQDQFSNLKTRVINGEDVNLDDYNEKQDSIKSNTDLPLAPDKTNASSQSGEDQKLSRDLDNYKKQTKWKQQ